MAIELVLIATNGSPSSARAVEQGLKVAAAEGAHARTLLIVRPSDRRVDIPALGPTAFMTSHQLSPAVWDRALEEANWIARDHGVPHDTEVWAAGNTVGTILERARKLRPDLLVIGAGHGRRRNALRIARHAPCPILIVTENDDLRSVA